MILAYNEDKGGVDVVDKMIDTYRCKVATRRWPMVVFYTTIDIAALNTLVLWLFKNRRWYEQKHGQRRRLFLHELGMALVLPQIERRHSLMGLRSDTRLAIDTILDLDLANIAIAVNLALKFCSCHVYKLKYGYFRFGGHYIKFHISGLIIQHSRRSHWIA